MQLRRTTRLLAICVFATVTCVLSGCGGGGGGDTPPVQATRRQNFDAILQAATTQMAAICAGTTIGDDMYGSSGYSEYIYSPGTVIPVPQSAQFRIASITKVFTATIVLRLVEQQRLSLDAPIGAYFPTIPIPYGGLITVRNLLSHTSGVADYLNDPIVQSSSWQPWTRDALILRAVASSPQFYPGGNQGHYSNTNYILLEGIIESVTGLPYKESLRQMITVPLGLGSTVLDEGNTGRLSGYISVGYPGSPSYQGISNRIHWSVARAAGGIVSNTLELCRFFDALFGGLVLSSQSLQDMTTPHSSFGAYSYGLGVEIHVDAFGYAYGHTGAIAGFSTFAAYRPQFNGTLVTLSNTEGFDLRATVAAALWPVAVMQ